MITILRKFCWLENVPISLLKNSECSLSFLICFRKVNGRSFYNPFKKFVLEFYSKQHPLSSTVKNVSPGITKDLAFSSNYKSK